MKRGTVIGWAFATTFIVLALAFARRSPERDLDPGVTTSPGATASAAALSAGAAESAPSADAATSASAGRSTAGPHQDLLYGRVTMQSGDVYEGRLRWGADEEALWGNYFNGFKTENPWVGHVPRDELPHRRVSFGAFGFELFGWNRPVDLGRPFMARFGDIERIEPSGDELRVTLKSGATFELDRFAADDVADGLRVWDERRGVVDLGEWRIRSIELLPTPRLEEGPAPLHGTVRTRQGDFTGLVQWDREQAVGLDVLEGLTPDGEVDVRFDEIRSIARRGDDGSVVTLLDGREIALTGTREVGEGNRGIYVDDPRYGRVLVSWGAFERVDFGRGGTGPAYGDFPPGRPLAGTVVTRSGDRYAGRLVYDLDESESTETLDAPAQGVDYTIPFELVASVVPGSAASGAEPAVVTLRSGERLELERAGDLGGGNAGVLVFVDDGAATEYVKWSDVERIDFEGAPAR